MPSTTTAALDGWYNLIQAANVLGIHPQSLRRLIKQGRFPARLIHGSYLVNASALYTFASRYDPRPGRKPGIDLFDTPPRRCEATNVSANGPGRPAGSGCSHAAMYQRDGQHLCSVHTRLYEEEAADA